METDRGGKNLAIAIVRWSARVLGVIIACFFLFMFIGELLEPYPSSEPMEPIAVIGLALMCIYAVAMFLALKWERLGSLLGMAGLGGVFVMVFLGLFKGNVQSGFSPKGILNPFLLALWLPILLYFLSWGLEKRLR